MLRLIAAAAVAAMVAIGVPAAFRVANTATSAEAAVASGPAAPEATPRPTPNYELPPRPIIGPAHQAAKNLGDGTRLAAWHVVNNVKVFQLDIEDTKILVAPGITKAAISINGSVPGPTIRVNQGERVRFIVHNGLTGEGTSIHWHGMDLPNDMDGVPDITQKEIPAGGTFSYEWTAISPGTHWYHSHMEGAQEGKGLYGALEVVPAAHDIVADRDYTLIFADGPLGFVINGRSFPGTTRMPARVGDRVRIRLISAGPDLIHSIHLHGGFFTVMAQDGRPLPVPYEADTLLLGVAQTYDLIWVPTRVGAWMIHCHIFQHSETKNGMTGMVSFFDVYPANGVVAPAVNPAGDVAEDRRPGS
ncbi:MAG TPA: multicopper oxidase domain-containing protein [Sporichthyaceae bacterium]|nr:multicopper oxidase domain-containing protein [Sporichthyaceae bacterium]